MILYPSLMNLIQCLVIFAYKLSIQNASLFLHYVDIQKCTDIETYYHISRSVLFIQNNLFFSYIRFFQDLISVSQAASTRCQNFSLLDHNLLIISQGVSFTIKVKFLLHLRQSFSTLSLRRLSLRSIGSLLLFCKEPIVRKICQLRVDFEEFLLKAYRSHIKHEQ